LSSSLLEVSDLALQLRCQANVIEPVDEAVLLEGLDIELADLLPVSGPDDLGLEVDLQLSAGSGLDCSPLKGLGVQDNGLA
jgi:hypothetical protein